LVRLFSELPELESYTVDSIKRELKIRISDLILGIGLLREGKGAIARELLDPVAEWVQSPAVKTGFFTPAVIGDDTRKSIESVVGTLHGSSIPDAKLVEISSQLVKTLLELRSES